MEIPGSMCRCLLILTVALGLCQPSALLGQKQETQTAAPSEVSGPAGLPTVTAPVPIYKPEPPYSKKARKAKYQGTVVLLIVVDSQGNVADVSIKKPLGMGLGEKAVSTVRTWKFHPALRNNIPVAVRVSVEITFRLTEEPKKSELDLTQSYLILTSRPRGIWVKKHDMSTLQKQLDEASSAGYRVLSFGRNRRDKMYFLLEKVSGKGAGVQLQSLLLAAKGIEDLQDEVCGAAAKGFRLALPTLTSAQKVGGKYIMVMEKTAILKILVLTCLSQPGVRLAWKRK